MLLELVEDLEKEGSKLSKLPSKPMERNQEALKVSDKVKTFLDRCPIINKPVAARLASKYVEQSHNTLKQYRFKKRRATFDGRDYYAIVLRGSIRIPSLYKSSTSAKEERGDGPAFDRPLYFLR